MATGLFVIRCHVFFFYPKAVERCILVPSIFNVRVHYFTEGEMRTMNKNVRLCSFLMACSVLTAGLIVLPSDGLAQSDKPARIAQATATLSILASPVQHVPAGSTQKQAAKDGMNVKMGDRILTGSKAMALITFLDGSTLTVQPESDITVTQADIVSGSPSTVKIGINFGTVWARVVKMADARSTFSLESNAASASVDAGLIGGKVNNNGSFECWTRVGITTVKDEEGQRYLTMVPGQKTIVQPGMFNARFGFRLDPDPVPQPFSVNQSVLIIETSSNVLPLVQMAEMGQSAGFVAPGIEVNQVFGSFTGETVENGHIVEVPGGVTGPFKLMLEGISSGAFTVSVAGLYNGEEIYRHALSGTLNKGERLATEITQQLDQDLKDHPKMAKVIGGRAAPLHPMNEPLPESIVLSPMETAQRPR